MNLKKKKEIILSTIKTIDDVEYIEPSYAATGIIQYATTGVKVDWSKNFTIKGVTALTGAHRSVIWGNYRGNSSTYAISFEWTAEKKLRAYLDPVASASIVTTNIVLTPVFDIGEIAIFEFNWYAATGLAVFSAQNLDGSKSETNTVTTSPIRSQVSTDFLLVGKDYRSPVSSLFNGTFKLYKLEYIENDQPKAKLLPMCSNNVPFLYEQVSGSYLYTEGGGYFATGRKIREVEYLDKGSSCYFDAKLFVNTTNTTVKTKFLPLYLSAGAWLFGARNSSSINNSTCCLYQVTAGYRLDWANGYLNNQLAYSTEVPSLTQPIEMEITRGYAKINDSVYTYNEHTSIDCTYSFYIGRANIAGTIGNGTQTRFFYFNIINNKTGDLYREFIPAIDQNGTPFLFDKITHSVFLPVTGIISGYGRRIIPVEHLVSSGTQYIDTGIKMTATDGVDITAKQIGTQTGRSRYLFGNFDSNNTELYQVAVRTGNGKYICSIGSSYKEGFSGYDLEFHKHQVINKEYFIDGVSYGTLTPSTFTPTRTSYLFQTHNVGFGYDTWQVTSAKIRQQDGSIERNYIPAKDENSKGFMFDTKTHTIFDNLGTGKFRVGNIEIRKDDLLPDCFERVNYLKSTSAQYINTLVSGGNDNLEISIDFKYSTFISFGGIYGNWISDSYNVTRLQLWDGGILGTDVSNLNTLSSDAGNQYKSSIGANVLHHVVSNKNSVTIDGIETTRTKLTSGTANTANICLFNRSLSNPNTSRNIGLEVYAFSIKNKGKLVLNFVPAIRNKDNKPGMYDTVSGKFFTNAGTGEFTYG